MKSPIKLYCLSGIGDCLWILQKLYDNTDRSFIINTWERDYAYSSPFLLGLDRVESVSQFNHPFETFENFMKQCKKNYNNYCELIPEDLDSVDELYLEANTYLEAGNHLRDYLPNLKTTYNLTWKENAESQKLVDELTCNKNTVVIYTSSIGTNSHVCMTPWTYHYWKDLIKHLFLEYSDINIIWIGARYDLDLIDGYTAEFKSEIDSNKLHFCIDKSSDFIVPLLKQSKCFISYQSGLSCISIIEKIPTMMFYYNFLDKLHNQICHPDSINNESIYKPVVFNNMVGDTQTAVDWVRQHLK